MTNNTSPCAKARSASAFGAKRADVVISRCCAGRDDGAFVFRVLDRQEPGREVLRIGVDGIAEQEQLHDRHRDDEAQGERVAGELRPFLAHRAYSRLKENAIMVSLSFRLSMWMNTSSRRGSTSRHVKAGGVRGADGALKRRAVGAGDMERPAEHGGSLDARRAA